MVRRAEGGCIIPIFISFELFNIEFIIPHGPIPWDVLSVKEIKICAMEGSGDRKPVWLYVRDEAGESCRGVMV